MAEHPNAALLRRGHQAFSTDRAVALFKIKATRGGKTLDADYREVIRVRNDQAVEEWNFAFDQHTFDDFCS